MEIFLTFLGTMAGMLAALFSWLGFDLSRKLAERSRPCIGESSWSSEKDCYFVTLKIFPGHYFVQTKSIEVPGAELSYVRKTDFGKLHSGEFRPILPYTVSVPVKADIVEIDFCMRPKISAPITIKVNLAKDEKPLEYIVFANPNDAGTN